MRGVHILCLYIYIYTYISYIILHLIHAEQAILWFEGSTVYGQHQTLKRHVCGSDPYGFQALVEEMKLASSIINQHRCTVQEEPENVSSSSFTLHWFPINDPTASIRWVTIPAVAGKTMINNIRQPCNNQDGPLFIVWRVDYDDWPTRCRILGDVFMVWLIRLVIGCIIAFLTN